MVTRDANDVLVVAADFDPTKETDPEIREKLKTPDGMIGWIEDKTVELATELQGTGALIKLNSALRAMGSSVIHVLEENLGVRVFADYKLCDISETVGIDGAIVTVMKPALVTVMCGAGVDSLIKLRESLPDSELIGVTVLTSRKNDDVKREFRCGIQGAVLRLATQAKLAGLTNLVSSTKEAKAIERRFGDHFGLTVAGIRPASLPVKGDDQNKARVATPSDALRMRIIKRTVIGRPITQALNRREAFLMVRDEIHEALRSS